jgi:TolB protein
MKNLVTLLSIVLLILLSNSKGTADVQDPPELPNWSVRKLAVVVRTLPSEEIVVIDPLGSKPRRLVEGKSPAWAPDGGRIAYCVHMGPRGFGQIQVINADGSGRRQLTHVKGGTCLPEWSPDGEKLAFTVYGKEPFISIGDKNGENVATITEGYGARWSPDGKQLVFCRNPQGRKTKGSIWIVNADGTGARRIIEDDSDILEPTWFPDGNSIVFSSERERKNNSAIYRVNLDGTGLEKIAADQNLAFFSPVLSPDSRLLVVDCISHSGYQKSVVLLDIAGNQEKTLALGLHPSVLWERR